MVEHTGMYSTGIYEAVQKWMAQATDAQVLTFREAVERLVVERLDDKLSSDGQSAPKWDEAHVRPDICECPVASGEGAWNEAHDPDCPAARNDGKGSAK